MDIPEYTFKEVGYSGSLQDIANILEYPQEQVLFSGLLNSQLFSLIRLQFLDMILNWIHFVYFLKYS